MKDTDEKEMPHEEVAYMVNYLASCDLKEVWQFGKHPTPKSPPHDLPDERAPGPESDVHQGDASRGGSLYGELSGELRPSRRVAIRQGAI